MCNILLLSIKENTNTSKKYHELDENLQTKFRVIQKV